MYYIQNVCKIQNKYKKIILEAEVKASGRIRDGRMLTDCENHVAYSYSGCGAAFNSSAAPGGRRAGRKRTGRYLLSAAVVMCE